MTTKRAVSGCATTFDR